MILIFLIVSSSFAQAKVVDTILAIVNNEYISKSDYNNYLSKLKKGGLVDPTLFEVTDKASLLKNKRNLISHLINEKLIDSAVKKLEMSVNIERVEQEIRTIARTNKITRATLITSLKKQGIKFSDYQDFIKKSIERKMLMEEKVNSNVKISNDDIVSHYLSKSTAKKSASFKYTLNQIYILKQNGGAKAAKKRAFKILDKLKNSSTSFESLTNQYSEYGKYVPEGDHFESNEILKEIDSVVRILPIGEYSNVINTKRAYVIVSLKNRVLIEDPELIRNKPKIAYELRKKLFAVEFKKWLKAEKENSFIRIN